MKEPIKLSRYQKWVHRVFATAHPTQELMDDLVEGEKAQAALKPFYYHDPSLEKMERIERILQRSAQSIIQNEISAKFNPQNWYASRYSDGSWPVLYSAEAEKTALKESLYHKRRFYQEELQRKTVAMDLCGVKLFIQTKRCVDLNEQKKLDAQKLISQDETGYPYCQKLAARAIQQGARCLRAPSARDKKGWCVPIFDRAIIQKSSTPLKFFKCLLSSRTTEIFYKLVGAVGVV